MRLSQAALDTCLDSPFFASLSVHGWHFTVYAPLTHALSDMAPAMQGSILYHRLPIKPPSKEEVLEQKARQKRKLEERNAELAEKTKVRKAEMKAKDREESESVKRHLSQTCESVHPLRRGQNRQNQEKRVSGSKNSHFPVPQKWAL